VLDSVLIFASASREQLSQLADLLLYKGIRCGGGAMLETCGSAGKGTDVKEGVPSR